LDKSAEYNVKLNLTYGEARDVPAFGMADAPIRREADFFLTNLADKKRKLERRPKERQALF